jgi:hypothetical protein
MVMEIISGGDHDRKTWSEKNKKYMRGSDPLFPCNSEMVPQAAKGMCYVYITPHLFNFAGAELGNPKEEDFKKAFTYCDALTLEDPNRNICFGGFGKEFVVLAKARDIRNVSDISEEEINKVLKWCDLAGNQNDIGSCVMYALGSTYWGGENDRSASVRFCSAVKESDLKDRCFNELIRMVNFYINDSNYKREFCSEIPPEYSANCKKII